MSVRLFVTPEVAKLEGFEESDGMATIGALRLFQEGGRFYVMTDLDGEIPPVLANVVDKLTAYDSLPVYESREMGMYEYGSAKAEIDLVDNGSKRLNMVYRVRLASTSFADARELIHLFRTGNSRPAESYQGPQGGLSPAGLELNLDVEKRRVEQLRLSLDATEKVLALRDAQVEQLSEMLSKIRFAVDKLKEGFGPFCLRNTPHNLVENIVCGRDQK